MESEKKTTFSIVGVVVIAIVLVLWLVSGRTASDNATDSTIKVMADPTLAPALQLTEQEKLGEVSQKKAEILLRVYSRTPLTSEEREEISGIMLAKAHLYRFSEEEQKAIFRALATGR